MRDVLDDDLGSALNALANFCVRDRLIVSRVARKRRMPQCRSPGVVPGLRPMRQVCGQRTPLF
jgi:hypothetical protein